MKNVMGVFTLLLLAGCESSVKDAKGETPVRFVVCLGEKDCSVSATFRDLDRCESYKAWAAIRAIKNLAQDK